MSTAHHTTGDRARLSAIHKSPKDRANPASVTETTGAVSSFVKVHSLGRREIRLSKSNLEHGDISFFPIRDFFTPTVVGGWDNEAAQKLTVIFDGQSFQTDIDGSQWTLRETNTLIDFLVLFEATAGDDLIIDRIGLHVYAFRLKSAIARLEEKQDGLASAAESGTSRQATA